jgi:hypothetical protein
MTLQDKHAAELRKKKERCESLKKESPSGITD